MRKKKKIDNSNLFNIDEIKNTIIEGDTIENLKKIPDESIDLIFADPPYFMQTEGELFRSDGSKFDGVQDEWDKFSSYNEYDKFCFEWLKECKRVLKSDGSIWVIGSFQNIYRLGYIMQNLDFWIINDVVWSKPNAAPNFAGSRFQNAHETLIWCAKEKKSKYTFNYKTMKYLNNDRQDRSIWEIGICIGNERLKGADGKKIHSTQKPEKLLYKVILSTSKPNDIVLDPFFGTGTTGAIAKLLGRNWIGIEREKEYNVAARERIDKVVPIIDDIASLKLEVKPPKVPMKKLIEVGMLKEDQILYDKNGHEICKVKFDGNVYDNKETLSIHKMSAKYLNLKNNNGWDYFYVKEDDLVPIDDLRYQYTKFVKKLKKTVYKNVKSDLINKVASNPDRYIGLFRPTSPKLKLIQNITQSHEISFGNFIEDIITVYLAQYYKNLPKKANYNGENVMFDQLFEDKNTIYMVEQKMRDDHDSTKKRGQFENFLKKADYLRANYPNHKIEAIMWFVDSSLKKNKKYYLEKMEEYTDKGVIFNLFYGAELTNYLNKSVIWDEITEYLTRWKNSDDSKIELNFEEDWDETKKELLKHVSKSSWEKIMANELVVDQILPILFPDGKYMEILRELKIEY